MSAYAAVLKAVKENPNKTAAELAVVLQLEEQPVDQVLIMLVNDGRVDKHGVALVHTFTVTLATPGVFSITAHGQAALAAVVLSTTGALPTGLAAATEYYVIAGGLTADAFEVAATPAGSAIATSVSQSGTHTATFSPTYSSTSQE